MGQAIEATGASRSTPQDHLRALVEKGQLVRYGNGKGSWYALP